MFRRVLVALALVAAVLAGLSLFASGSLNGALEVEVQVVHVVGHPGWSLIDPGSTLGKIVVVVLGLFGLGLQLETRHLVDREKRRRKEERKRLYAMELMQARAIQLANALTDAIIEYHSAFAEEGVSPENMQVVERDGFTIRVLDEKHDGPVADVLVGDGIYRVQTLNRGVAREFTSLAEAGQLVLDSLFG